ncbi:hypothetical protein [Methanosalsum natronophilum]|uniref:hypothetical protein n=1 Tax=Methanosalsum natronophilum TaxID=768733 RepID=UPI0021699BB5|nr:hypothetical protein [Methanosalsum natronophilum]MCS3924890.1 hypothetical protein [Methanosalsum natronophilum]
MNETSLHQLLIKSSKIVLEKEPFGGCMSPGHNGLYNDPETPVRNSGHWLITFSKCYELTGDIKYKNKVLEIAEYLSSKKARPYGFSFYHREKKGKDRCNGLMGQAWTIESLVKATEVLGDEKYRKLAAEVFNQHPFNHEYGLWHRLEVDGKVLSMDETFNHQLWFAAAGSLLGEKYPGIMDKVNFFMEKLDKNLIILNNGLIHHHIETLRQSLAANNKNDTLLLKLSKLRYNSILQKIPVFGMDINSRIQKQLIKSIGYHSFNMYAFALLYQNIPGNKFWDSKKFKPTLNYMLTDEYIKKLEDNKYGYPYNPPGFEVPFALFVLSEMNKSEYIKLANWWTNKQFNKCYNGKTGLMDRNTYDPLTHTARIYEISRLPNHILKQIEIKDYNEN